MTVTIKVNYQTTFQKKEAKTSINRRESEMLFSFLKLLSAHHPKSKESKFTFYLSFFLALIT